MTVVAAGFLPRIADQIVDHPARIVLAFVVVTGLLAPGMLFMESDPGTEPFIEGVPEAEALEDVTLKFEPTFGPNEPTTQLIQHEDDNVLARDALATQLAVVDYLEGQEELRVQETMAPASMIATEIDPTAETTGDRRRVLERASAADLATAIEAMEDDRAFESMVSEDFSPVAGEASAAFVVVTHAVPAGDQAVLTDLQYDVVDAVHGIDDRILVFGTGIVDAEFQAIVTDSLTLVIPIATLLILGLLFVAYRDPYDLLLGLTAIVMTIVWTFGFAGLAGVPFNQILIAVPILLIAIGIDFGIHIMDRYREKRIRAWSASRSMRVTTRNLLVAFTLIAGTTMIGFGVNVTSDLAPIREFGLVTAIGMFFTLLIFGIYLPAAKLWSDRKRREWGMREFETGPIAPEDSALGRVLVAAAIPARKAPILLLVVTVVVTAGAGGYGAGVDTSFDIDDFLPEVELPRYVEYLPEPMKPREYTVPQAVELIEKEFATGEDDTITIHLQEDMTGDDALRQLVRVEQEPPPAFVEVDDTAQSRSVLLPIGLAAREDPVLAAQIARNDRSGDGVPDRGLAEIYDRVEAAGYGDLLAEYLTADRDETRIILEVRSDATMEEVTADGRAFADRYRGHAMATGQLIVYQAVAEDVFDTAVEGFVGAIVVDGIFLILLFHVFIRRSSFGVAAIIPIIVTVSLLTATMRAAGIPFNALTATILSISIGLGVDYTVHLTHRYHIESVETDDPIEAIETTLRGTGGALTGTMLTTAIGLGCLVLAVTPLLGQFGLLTALSIILSYATTLIVLPSLLVVLDRYGSNPHAPRSGRDRQSGGVTPRRSLP